MKIISKQLSIVHEKYNPWLYSCSNSAWAKQIVLSLLLPFFPFPSYLPSRKKKVNKSIFVLVFFFYFFLKWTHFTALQLFFSLSIINICMLQFGFSSFIIKSQLHALYIFSKHFSVTTTSIQYHDVAFLHLH